MKFKFILLASLSIPAIALSGCSTNPATGKQQFTALMSPAQENQVGAEEHQKVIEQFGLYEDAALNNYVRSVGQKVTQRTERPDVQFKFYVIDSPIVNAFALPGGYIYVSRGLLALANNEAQLAAVLSHEAGHITGRHSAERYSRGVVTSLGAGLLSAALGSQEASQALGVGANLFMSSYSREQEHEADSLGLRYMTQGGYAPDEMSAFLSSLQAQTGLDATLAGQTGNQFSYFSTHPATGDRVQKTLAEGRNYNDSDYKNRDAHLSAINGMVYGDSAKHGFARGNTFYHPSMGFKFNVPNGFNITNQPTQIVATSSNSKAVIIFDMAGRANGQSAGNYIQNTWLKDNPVSVENISVNGMPAAAASFSGTVNGTPMTIQVVAIEWQAGRFARFQVAIPSGTSAGVLDALKSSTYSFQSMSASEKSNIKPYRLETVSAKSGDTIASMARQLPFDKLNDERFRVLNGLLPNQALVTGQRYKIVAE